MYYEGLLDNDEMIQTFPYQYMETSMAHRMHTSKMQSHLSECSIDLADWCMVGSTCLVAKDQETLLKIILLAE